MTKSKNKPYSKRTDLEKILNQWTKLSGLHEREEWSASIVRAGTMAELAANIAVKRELVSQRQLDDTFVDSLLKWANGLTGKIDRLLIPVAAGNSKKTSNFKVLKRLSKEINEFRNEVVHRGAFASKTKSEKITKLAVEFVNVVLDLYKLKLEGLPKKYKKQ
jgi:hypothetical protein